MSEVYKRESGLGTRQTACIFRCKDKRALEQAIADYLLQWPREGYCTTVDKKPTYDFVRMEWVAIVSHLNSCD